LTEEQLQETLNQIIEQIEKESGYELTQEEIEQVVESFMNQNI
jgi:isopropylmalate/homocitrate/citramalate synthase